MQQRRPYLLPVLLGVIGLCFMLLTPPGAAPDEPTHLIRAGAVVRGEVGGEFDPTFDNGGGEIVNVPDRLRVPDHFCYAWIENRAVSVDCADPIDYTGSTVELRTSAEDYPVWSHVIFGVGTLIPEVPSIWPARLLGLLVGFTMIGAVMTRMRDAWGRTALIAALTPMVFATVATVNPSSFAISGAIAVWAVLWYSPIGGTAAPLHPRWAPKLNGWLNGWLSDGWLFALGWALLAMSRRDGLMWASMILAFFTLATGRSVIAWLRRLERGPFVVVVATLVAQMVWGFMTGTRVGVLGSLAPLMIVAAEGGRLLWLRASTRSARAALVGASIATLGVLLVAVMLLRPGGLDVNLAILVAQQGTDHVLQAIGVLGWLDVYLPDAAMQMAVIGFGIMFGVALMRRPMVAARAAAVLAIGVLAAWAFEMMSGEDYGYYWQGRYSLPFLVGVPLVLGVVSLKSHRDHQGDGWQVERRMAVSVSAIMMVVVNAAAWAGARRWGVGTEGSYFPWHWWTQHQPIPPLLVLVVMAAASTAVVYLVGTTSSVGVSDHQVADTGVADTA